MVFYMDNSFPFNPIWQSFFFFFFLMATYAAYIDRIGAAAAGHSHSNTGSNPQLRTMPRLVAASDP